MQLSPKPMETLPLHQHQRSCWCCLRSNNLVGKLKEKPLYITKQTKNKNVAYMLMYVCAELSVHLPICVGQYECMCVGGHERSRGPWKERTILRERDWGKRGWSKWHEAGGRLLQGKEEDLQEWGKKIMNKNEIYAWKYYNELHYFVW